MNELSIVGIRAFGIFKFSKKKVFFQKKQFIQLEKLEKILFHCLFLLFLTSSFCQDLELLKKESSKLVSTINTNDYKKATELIYPATFENGFTLPFAMNMRFAGNTAFGTFKLEINNDNLYIIKDYQSNRFCLIKFHSYMEQKFKVKKDSLDEELNLYLTKKKEKIKNLGHDFQFIFDKKLKILTETIIDEGLIVAISDKLTKNEWRFIFELSKWLKFKDFSEIFGDAVKKEIGL